jgi:GAF domain-containing protein
VPLLVQARLIGVLHVGTLEPREFTADDAELLQLVADRIALAVDHARLYEAERSAAEQLRRLEALTEAALAHLALDDLLDVLLVRICELLATDAAMVMLLDEREELALRATVGIEGSLQPDEKFAVGVGFIGRIAGDDSEALALEDAAASPLVPAALRETGLASMVGAPLVVGGRVTGVLALGTWERRPFDPPDIDLLQRAADRIALAIDNARLYEAERTARADAERAAERIRRIESITEVALHHIALDEDVLERLSASDAVLVDGTFWRDDELVELGISRRTAREMGHVPLSGPDGTLEALARLERPRKVFVHVNNTNPVLLEGSPEREAVVRAGLEVGDDGLEVEL